MNHSKIRKFLKISLFFNSSDLGFESKNVLFAAFGVYFALGLGSVDPHIFADLDPGIVKMMRIQRIRILSTV